MAAGTARGAVRIGAPRARASQGIHEGINSQCFFLLLSLDAPITRIVANQPTSATRMAPAMVGEIICTLSLLRCGPIVPDRRARATAAPSPLVLSIVERRSAD